MSSQLPSASSSKTGTTDNMDNTKLMKGRIREINIKWVPARNMDSDFWQFQEHSSLPVNHLFLPSYVPIKCNIECHLSPLNIQQWETVALTNILYFEVGYGQRLDHGFVAAVDLCRRKLHCQIIVLCILKDRDDKVQLLERFMFLGFRILAPVSPLCFPNNNDHIYMAQNSSMIGADV